MLFPTSSPVVSGHRVVLTGAGIVTALGLGWAANAEGFRHGRQAFRPVTLFDASRQRTRRAAEVDLPARVPSDWLPPRQYDRMDRAGRMLWWAAHEAWHQAGWRSGPLELILGTTSAGMNAGQEFFEQASDRPGRSRGQASRVIQYQPQRQALDLLDACRCEGPVRIIANACASGANAVGEAFEAVRSGRTPRAMAGGYDALSHLVFAGFDALQALSPTTCRPFDAHRDGLGLGEGAAVVTLETLESARGRQATILGEILGYGAATDRHHLTQPHPEGEAAERAMTQACQQAGLEPGSMDYVNAHGTGTPLNDASEAAAITRWAGSAAGRLAVSSIKGGIGHLLGAAGAVEVVVCLMALGGQWLPPGVPVTRPDPACGVPLVTAPRDAEVRHALTNSFGFGGANASLVLGRCP
jgi:3-oxoacyl-[acyl-carrier-protein] synthase II